MYLSLCLVLDRNVYLVTRITTRYPGTRERVPRYPNHNLLPGYSLEHYQKNQKKFVYVSSARVQLQILITFVILDFDGVR